MSEAVDITLFDGDPSRGDNHRGCMYAFRVAEFYRKSTRGFPNRRAAATVAIMHIEAIGKGVEEHLLEVLESLGDRPGSTEISMIAIRTEQRAIEEAE